MSRRDFRDLLPEQIVAVPLPDLDESRAFMKSLWGAAGGTFIIKT